VNKEEWEKTKARQEGRNCPVRKRERTKGGAYLWEVKTNR